MVLLPKFIHGATRYGITQVYLTGGEPTLHRHFIELAGKILEAGLPVSIVTNGRRFDKVVQLKKNYKRGRLSACFSLDGLSHQQHDDTRGKGSYAEVMEAITLAKEYRIPFEVFIVLNNRTKCATKEIVKYALGLGPFSVGVSLQLPSPRSIANDLTTPVEEYPEILAMVPKSRRVRTFHRANTLSSCGALRSMNIDYNGKASFCCDISHFAVKDQGTEIVGDLHSMSLAACISRHYLLMSRFIFERSCHAHAFNPTEDLLCMWCLRWFGKLEWLKEMPDNPWSKALFGEGLIGKRGTRKEPMIKV